MRELMIYVTGTDTGIGKTFVSVVLLHALRAREMRAVGMKPVASGCELHAGQWRNDDALALIDASAVCMDYMVHNPYALPAAIAPQLAARAADVEVELVAILAAYQTLTTQAQAIVVEGVGGWAAPLADGLDQVDLVRALQLPVLLVVGLRLGCLSHARLTARAIIADGCRLIGWVGNPIDPDLDRRDAYLQLLRDALPAPCWGVLPYAPGGAGADALAAHLDPSALL